MGDTTIEFEELDGSPTISADLDKVELERTFKVAWDDRFAFIAQIWGQPDEFETGAYCYHCLIRPMPGKTKNESSDDGYCSYEFAIVEARYSSAAHTMVSESFEPSAEFITLDASDFRWGSAEGDKLKSEEAPGKLIVTLDYVMMWKNLSAIPTDALNLIGCVNSAIVNPSKVNPILIDLDFEPQTLLYHPPIIQRVWDFIQGQAAYDLTYRFTYRPNRQGGEAKGWNWIWRAATGQYEQIYSRTTEQPVNIYPVVSFAGLWTS